ncbi:melanotransferrin isoform X1 [Neodiprion lecontei]|uniref:Melanotransferrin isoform X1 n=2 Tax=Neodiprion lecontei TaxID=441921 RepID=A0A6J0B8M9_NEOLC|nr:melanotransferrin isoform X1 [Neodiprion lecontei]
MDCGSRMWLLISLLVVYQIFQATNGLLINNTIVWCTVSDAEQRKCEAFSKAVDQKISSFTARDIALSCKQAFNEEACMTMLDEEKAHLTTLDPGEVFIAGRYHSLLPIMQEKLVSGLINQYAVAVVKKGSLPDVLSLRDLRGKKACFAGVGTQAGWVIPIHTLMEQGGMEVIDCNNHVKSTINYFGPSCAINALIDKYNPLGDNSDQLCKLCIGKVPGGKCTSADPYAGYEGAFKCLLEAGDIAFLVDTTVQEMTSNTLDLNTPSKDQFELLCTDGSRRPVDDFRNCNWGSVPSRAIITSSATHVNMRKLYQKFLITASQEFSKSYSNSNSSFMNDNRFGNRDGYEIRPGFDNRQGYDRFDDRNYNGNFSGNRNFYYRNGTDNNFEQGNNYGPNPSNRQAGNPNIADILPLENFDLFESSPRYGEHHNLLFSDSAREFHPLAEKDQNYPQYLGQSLNDILAVRHCPVNRMTLCVTSEPEMEKCIKMRIALKAQLLKPEMVCYKGHSQIHCMQAIQNGDADVTVLDASDVYTAGLRYGLIPFISEVYNLGSPDYYVVAVAKEEDPSTDLTYLKNKYTCHPGINTAAGWVYPLAYLISNGWIRGYGCDSVRAAAEYFTKSCIPGALSTEYNTGVPYDNMCDLCHGVSFRYCRRDASEDYFGYTGAFRCLVEGGGNVAFVKHTTVAENTDGKRRSTWARNTFTKDFELLCPDGTRRPTGQYMECNLGKVAANAIVARSGYYGYNETEINAYINLFVYAQQYYGRKDPDEFSFSMFYSPPPYSDLIFQDAAQQLVVIPPEKRQFSAYVGPDFMRARRITDCNAGASAIQYTISGSIAMGFLATLLGS